MKMVPRYQTYELVVEANYGASQINFPDIPELRSDTTQDTMVVNIEVFPSEAVPTTYSGNTNATRAQIANAFLTVYQQGFQQVNNVPLQRLVQIRNEAAGYYYSGLAFEVIPMRVEWTKSYLQFAVPPGNNARFSFLFNFGYVTLPPGGAAAYFAARDQQLQNGVIVLP